MRSGNNRFARAVRASDQIFLDEGNLFERNFDSEVAARDHDAVGSFDDFIDIVERLVLLDFRHDRDIRAAFLHEVTDFDDVFGATHEGNRDPVDLHFDPECEMLEIAIGHRIDVECPIRIVDSLRPAQHAADLDARDDIGLGFVDDP